MPFLRQLWDDFKEFWKTQLFWGLVLAGLTTAWGVYRGSFSGSANDVVLPYVGMFAFFYCGQHRQNSICARTPCRQEKAT